MTAAVVAAPRGAAYESPWRLIGNGIATGWRTVRSVASRASDAMKPRQSVLKLMRWFAGTAIVGALLVAGAYAMQGLGLALLIVAAMFVTIEVVPGFHYIAVSKVGLPIVVLATAWLTTKFVSIGTIVGAFALAFALIIKVFVVRGMRAMHLRGENFAHVIDRSFTHEKPVAVTVGAPA